MLYHVSTIKSYPHLIEVDDNIISPSHISVYKLENFKFVKSYQVDIVIPEIYEWLLKEIGPSDDMIWDSDRIYFNKADTPSITLNRITWLKERTFVFSNQNKWLLHSGQSCYYNSNKRITGIAFSNKDDAMLFKLTWG